MVNRKKLLILIAIVVLGVAKGPQIQTKILNWYGERTNSFTLGRAKVGLGEYLLPPLRFEVISGECEPFFKKVLQLDLLRAEDSNASSLSHSRLPILTPGCVIAVDPYFTSVNTYVRECLGDKTESNESLSVSCVRATLNLRAAIVDQLFPEPKFAEITDAALLANLAFAAFVKLDAQELSGATLRLMHLKPNSYTAAKWFAFATVLNLIEYGGDPSRAKKAIETARDLNDTDPSLGGLDIFLNSHGFKDQNGMVAAQKLLNDFPRSAEAKAWVGYYHWMMGNRETALALYREAAALDAQKTSYQDAVKVLEANSPEDDLIRKFFPVTWNREDLK